MSEGKYATVGANLRYRLEFDFNSIPFQEMNKGFQAEIEKHIFPIYVILVVTLLIYCYSIAFYSCEERIS